MRRAARIRELERIISNRGHWAEFYAKNRAKPGQVEQSRRAFAESRELALLRRES